ncbi:hypothetical protein LXL04_039041 [Taraxacum kok-saghyz]
MGLRSPLWMLIVCSQVMVIAAVTDGNDVAALNAMKSTWKNLPPNWKGPDPCGTKWDGINCTTSRVTSLFLAGMGVRTNNIEDITSLSQLENLDLSNNKGIKAPLPPSLENLKNLKTLILVGCSFSGPIPDTVGSLKQLVFLYVFHILVFLYNIIFINDFLQCLAKLINLSWLDLSDNKLRDPFLSNEIALGLDMLKKARHFHLADNQLSGDIRFELFSSDMSLIHDIQQQSIIRNNPFLDWTCGYSSGTINWKFQVLVEQPVEWTCSKHYRNGLPLICDRDTHTTLNTHTQLTKEIKQEGTQGFYVVRIRCESYVHGLQLEDSIYLRDIITAAPHHQVLEGPVEAPTSSNSVVANPATDSVVVNTAIDSSTVSTGLDTPPDPEIHRGSLTLSQLCKHST